MHDIRTIRDDPAAFDAGLARRGVAPVAADLVALDASWRAMQTRLQDAQNRRNTLSRDIGAAMAAGDRERAEALKAEVAALKGAAPDLEAETFAAEVALNQQLALLPNLPDADVPDGPDESANREIARHGQPRAFDAARPARDHAELGPPLGLDFDTGVAIAGARFAFLRGQVARLHRALGQFMLDLHTGAHGYTECAPPLLVRDAAVFGTGQLPKFADDLFRTTDDRWLIPTAEVSLTNSVRERILDVDVLPLRLVALTPCFRSEAGAAGRDTKGLIRQHQFDKVELVSITAPADSAAEHERMTDAAEAVLRALDLPYRRMLLCAGDMGATARRTYDLEVWLPGQAAYREISSCSNCGDFQARRMDARMRVAGDKRTGFVHTLNGSGVAVGRALVAVLENHQDTDGTVRVPAALIPYMGGIDRLVPAG